MSQFSARPMFSSRGGGVPRGEEVASFASYAEAQHAVDSLSDEGFPVQCLTIIGTDLRQVERITGRMSWGRAVAAGAGSGLWIGLFFGAMMSLVGSEAVGGGVSMVTAVLLGVVWGIVFQVGSYALTRGRRDFTSVSQVVASRYSIIASDRAAEATLALADVPGNLSRGGDAARRAEERRAARAQARGGSTAFGSRPDERPRYGVRVPEGVDPFDYSGSSEGSGGSESLEGLGSPESPEGSDISGSSDDDGRGGAETAPGERGEIDPYLRKAPGSREDRPGDGEA